MGNGGGQSDYVLAREELTEEEVWPMYGPLTHTLQLFNNTAPIISFDH